MDNIRYYHKIVGTYVLVFSLKLSTSNKFSTYGLSDSYK